MENDSVLLVNFTEVKANGKCLEGVDTERRSLGRRIMTDRKNNKKTIRAIKADLKRLKKILKSKYVRPADYATRDRLARRLRDVEKLGA